MAANKPISAVNQSVHKDIKMQERDIVRKISYAYVIELLHKLPAAAASQELRIAHSTLLRLIDPDSSIGSISYRLAAYIVFMCETDSRIQRIISSNPRATAYYKRTPI